MNFTKKVILGAVFLSVLPSIVFAGSDCTSISSNLKKGDTDSKTGNSVSQLQKFLANKYGINETDIVSGYFGDRTATYVGKYQDENGLDVVGMVGKFTRALINTECKFSSENANSVLGAVASASSVSSPTIDKPSAVKNTDGTYTLTVSGTGSASVYYGAAIYGDYSAVPSYTTLRLQALVSSKNKVSNAFRLFSIKPVNGVWKNQVTLPSNYDISKGVNIFLYTSTSGNPVVKSKFSDLVKQEISITDIFPVANPLYKFPILTIYGKAQTQGQIGFSVSSQYGDKEYASGLFSVDTGKWSYGIDTPITSGIHTVYVYSSDSSLLATSTFEWKVPEITSFKTTPDIPAPSFSIPANTDLRMEWSAINVSECSVLSENLAGVRTTLYSGSGKDAFVVRPTDPTRYILNCTGKTIPVDPGQEYFVVQKSFDVRVRYLDRPDVVATLELSKDVSSPANSLKSYDTYYYDVAGVLRVRATGGDIILNRLDVSVLEGDSARISGIGIYDSDGLIVGSGTPLLPIKLLSPLVIKQGTDKLLSVKASLSKSISPGVVTLGISPASIIEGMEMSSGEPSVVSVGSGVFFSQMFVYRTFPNITKLSVPTLTLNNGKQTLLNFKIAANSREIMSVSKENISIGKLTLRISTTTVNILGLNVYMACDSGSGYVVGGGRADRALLAKDLTVLPYNKDIDIYPQTLTGVNSSVHIPAGKTCDFNVVGTIKGATTGSSIMTSLVGDLSPVNPNGGTTAFGVIDSIKDNNFIWSPNTSSIPALTTSDWLNGYLVPGIYSKTYTISEVLSK